MFTKVTLFLATVFAVLASTATASPLTPPLFDKCNTGPVVCCNSLQAPQSAEAAEILALVGVAVGDVVAQVGAQCNAITGVGAGAGANCGTSPVCCQQNFLDQLVGVNCSPVNIGA